MTAADDRLAALEAEATLMLSRIRTACDTNNLDETIRLYRRIPELRLELLACRHLIARQGRITSRQYGGSNPGLESAELKLAELLALLGVEMEPGMRRVFG